VQFDIDTMAAMDRYELLLGTVVPRPIASARRQPLEVSYSDLGGRFGVSSTHVRNLLQAAEELDLVRLAKARGQLVQLKPQLLGAFDRLVADAMSGFDFCYQLALRAPG
jgi:hypothetical protein